MRHSLMFAALGGILPVIVACTGTEDETEVDTEELAEASEASTVAEASEATTAAEISEVAPMIEPGAGLEATTNDHDRDDVSFKGQLQAFDNGLSLQVNGMLKGLNRRKDVHVKLTAKAIAEARCTNPGGHEPPGKNPVFRQIEVSGRASFAEREIRFGSLTFMVKSQNLRREVFGAPDCPNRRWKETIVDVKFKSFKLTVEQGNDQVARQSCAFRWPTFDGLVPQRNLDCR